MPNDSKGKTHENRQILMLVSLFFVFTGIIYAPLEIYLTNINEFWFSLSQFWYVVAIMGIFFYAVIVLTGLVLPLRLQNVYIGAMFGGTFMMYLQGNFLNVDLGVLNGGYIDWASYAMKFLINLGIWLVVIIVCMCLISEKRPKIKAVVKYVAVYLTLIQAVTLSVLLLTTKSDIDKDAMTKYLSDKDIYQVSQEENIIVFVMDMFDDRYFKELLEQEPELADEFEGFIQYVNSTGNYSTTSYANSTLLTGQYLRNEKESLYEDVNALYEDCITYEMLSDTGYRLDLYTYAEHIPTELLANASNYIDGSYEISNYPRFTRFLYQLVAIRYMPDFVKPHIWMSGNEFMALREVSGEADDQSVDNFIFYENMLSEGITVQEDHKCFKYIFLDGAHYPYTMNENVERVANEEETSDLQCARGVVKILLEYMEGMKAVGAYDNSSIIITADHGYYWNGVLTNPVLLVKPKNATGAMQVSNAPVSQHDLHPSILSMAGLNEQGEYGESYFDIEEGEERERLFYQYYLSEDHVNGKYRLIEYSIDPEGNERKYFHLTGVEYTVDGEIIDHFAKCSYCQSGAEEPNDNAACIVHE